MKVKFFRHGYANGWELNFIGKVYQIRIGFYQLAFWKNLNPIFNYTRVRWL